MSQAPEVESGWWARVRAALRRKLDFRSRWNGDDYTVIIKHTGGMEIVVEYEDAVLDVAVPGEWSDGVCHLRDFQRLYSVREPAHDLSEEERALLIRHMEEALKAMKLRWSYGGPR